LISIFVETPRFGDVYICFVYICTYAIWQHGKFITFPPDPSPGVAISMRKEDMEELKASAARPEAALRHRGGGINVKYQHQMIIPRPRKFISHLI